MSLLEGCGLLAGTMAGNRALYRVRGFKKGQAICKLVGTQDDLIIWKKIFLNKKFSSISFVNLWKPVTLQATDKNINETPLGWGRLMSPFHRLTKKQTCFGSLVTLFLNFLNCLSASKASFPSVARDSSSLSFSESPRSSFDFTNCLYSSNLSFSLLSQAALSSVSVSITSSYSGKRTLLFFLHAVASGKSKSLSHQYQYILTYCCEDS